MFCYWCLYSRVTSDQVLQGHRGHFGKPLSAGGWPRKLNNIIEFNYSSFTQNNRWNKKKRISHKRHLKRKQLNVLNVTCRATVYILSVPVVLI
jgi:hypothetical protein